jgi:hypothetical protein
MTRISKVIVKMALRSRRTIFMSATAPTAPRKLLANGLRRALAASACLAIITAAAPIGRAQTGKPADTQSWQAILSLQLKSEYNCDFEKVLFDRDVEVGQRITKEGRARCLDGREFDFSRDATHEKFILRLCMPTVC